MRPRRAGVNGRLKFRSRLPSLMDGTVSPSVVAIRRAGSCGRRRRAGLRSPRTNSRGGCCLPLLRCAVVGSTGAPAVPPRATCREERRPIAPWPSWSVLRLACAHQRRFFSSVNRRHAENSSETVLRSVFNSQSKCTGEIINRCTKDWMGASCANWSIPINFFSACLHLHDQFPVLSRECMATCSIGQRNVNAKCSKAEITC
jgi:hypothetical protein